MLLLISCLEKILLCLFVTHRNQTSIKYSDRYTLLLRAKQTKQTIKTDYTTRTHYAHASSSFDNGFA